MELLQCARHGRVGNWEGVRLISAMYRLSISVWPVPLVWYILYKLTTLSTNALPSVAQPWHSRIDQRHTPCATLPSCVKLGLSRTEFASFQNLPSSLLLLPYLSICCYNLPPRAWYRSPVLGVGFSARIIQRNTSSTGSRTKKTLLQANAMQQ